MVNHPNRGQKARFTLTIVADSFGYVWDETVATHLRELLRLQKSEGLPTAGELFDRHGRRVGRWAYKEAK